MNSTGSYALSKKYSATENGKHTSGMGAMYLRIFELYLDMTARDKAVLYGEKALEHYRLTDDKKTLIFILEKLAELYDFFERYDNALMCYSQCEHLKKSAHNSAGKSENLQ